VLRRPKHSKNEVVVPKEEEEEEGGGGGGEVSNKSTYKMQHFHKFIS
jgi:hypothetical protein